MSIDAFSVAIPVMATGVAVGAVGGGYTASHYLSTTPNWTAFVLGAIGGVVVLIPTTFFLLVVVEEQQKRKDRSQ